MAIVKLKDVPVTYVNGRGFGVKVTESHESKGKTFKQQYTLWFDAPHGLSVGDVVSVSGFLGAKVSEWQDANGTTRHSVELSVNRPELADSDATRPVDASEPEPWASTSPGTGFDAQTGAQGFDSAEVPF
jgi:hypothetical protein